MYTLKLFYRHGSFFTMYNTDPLVLEESGLEAVNVDRWRSSSGSHKRTGMCRQPSTINREYKNVHTETVLPARVIFHDV